MRFRLAISTGLAAAAVLAVFFMIRYDSTVEADGTVFTQQSVALSESNSVSDPSTSNSTSEVITDPTDVMTAGTDFSQTTDPPLQSQLQPELEPIYVYPDGSLAPSPSDLPIDSFETSEYESYDDDHHERDHDDDRYESDHDDDDELYRLLSPERLAQLLGGDDHDDDDDDDHHEEHDDD